MDIYSHIPPILIAAFAALFFFITWFRFHWAVFLLFLLLPNYLLRFRIGPIPSTFLEIMVLSIIIVWIIKKIKDSEHIRNIKNIFNIPNISNIFTIGIVLFLTAATLSIFTAVDIRAALGEWKAFYIEPALLFFILLSVLKKESSDNVHFRFQISDFRLTNRHDSQKSAICNLQSAIVLALILSGLATSILSIFQHFTGWMVPYDFWEKGNSFRVTAWYGFPNAVGLYLAPIVPLAIGVVWRSLLVIKKKTDETAARQYSIFNIQYISIVFAFLLLLTAPLAILFAKSTGAIIGVIAGIATLFLIYKKTRWPTILTVIFLVTIVVLPPSYLPASGGGEGRGGVVGSKTNTLYEIKQELFFQDRSGQIRLSMWAETWEFLKDHPIRGAGLASYQERIAPYHTQVNGENIEIFHHPHNLFLTMWVNIGLLGLAGFLLILVSFFQKGMAAIKKTNSEIRNLPAGQAGPKFEIFILSSMITLLVMGLVDSPYVKNDWAIVFWLLIVLLSSHVTKEHPS